MLICAPRSVQAAVHNKHSANLRLRTFDKTGSRAGLQCEPGRGLLIRELCLELGVQLFSSVLAEFMYAHRTRLPSWPLLFHG